MISKEGWNTNKFNTKFNFYLLSRVASPRVVNHSDPCSVIEALKLLSVFLSVFRAKNRFPIRKYSGGNGPYLKVQASTPKNPKLYHLRKRALS